MIMLVLYSRPAMEVTLLLDTLDLLVQAVMIFGS